MSVSERKTTRHVVARAEDLPPGTRSARWTSVASLWCCGFGAKTLVPATAQIRADLSVPDETESLRVPNASERVAGTEPLAPECLELAPFSLDQTDTDS